MNRDTVEVFHALMKQGWIDRREDSAIWSRAESVEVQEELEDFKSVLGVDLIHAGDRLYLVPTQENDLFLKNNVDFRRDIKADNSVRVRDLYLLNYLAIYILYLFFNGEGNDPLCREFITRDNLIALFTAHCESVEKASFKGDETQRDYGDNFRQLAQDWLGKVEGERDTNKLTARNGVINRILNKFKVDELFDTDSGGLLRPTRKLKDLMPYFLRKDRVAELRDWLRTEDENAADQ